MASELPNSSKASTSFYEFEDLEVIEFDEETLRELLQDPEEEEVQESYYNSEPSEAQINPNKMMDHFDFHEKIKPFEDNYDWLETMETTPDVLCNDLAFWYEDACSQEMAIGSTETPEAIDSSSQIYNAFQMDEVAYTDLWQDNY